jgi:hypothetical protein
MPADRRDPVPTRRKNLDERAAIAVYSRQHPFPRQSARDADRD